MMTDTPASFESSYAKALLAAKIDNDKRIKAARQTSEHSIFASASDRKRILAHWEGYCQNNGYRPFKVGDKVTFVGPWIKSQGAPMQRIGTIRKFTGTPPYVSFKYRHGGQGGKWLTLRQMHHGVF